jgi:hypothetical protein
LHAAESTIVRGSQIVHAISKCKRRDAFTALTRSRIGSSYFVSLLQVECDRRKDDDVADIDAAPLIV